jgi:hypothetical protein
MAQYYFITTLLPPLKIGSAPEIGSTELDFILKLNLTKKDYHKLDLLRKLIDIENIRSFWRKIPIDPGGNFDEKELEENLLHQEGLPAYVFAFMEQYPETRERLHHFPELIRSSFQAEMKEASKQDAYFVQQYLSFEWQWRTIFLALRALDLGRDVFQELSDADPDNPFIADIFEQLKASKTYTPPEQFRSLQAMYDVKKHAPLELELALSEWRFEYIEEMIGWNAFDIYRILGYVTQLEIVEKWLELDKRKGLQFIDQTMKEIA